MTLNCPYCGAAVIHTGFCHRIKAVEYHENGTTKRVELWPLEPALSITTGPISVPTVCNSEKPNG